MPLAPLAIEVTMDSTTWAALALVLTMILAVGAWLSWRRRGPAAGLRGLAWTLVPVAAWLTGTLRLAAAIVEDVLHWATRLVFSPVVWAGLAVAGVAVALWVVSGVLLSRGIGVHVTAGEVSGKRARKPSVKGAPAREIPAARRGGPATKADTEEPDDMADIEAILKRHGI